MEDCLVTGTTRIALCAASNHITGRGRHLQLLFFSGNNKTMRPRRQLPKGPVNLHHQYNAERNLANRRFSYHLIIKGESMAYLLTGRYKSFCFYELLIMTQIPIINNPSHYQVSYSIHFGE
jgi:hypothetical protein